ncbi:EamA family transporter [Paraflavitalea speifideaquila]|uniref:EamA family transporter n=1 Tax=Paraflavitalea speifideaquila TaxID=3076558 RepID=UPI0033130269
MARSCISPLTQYHIYILESISQAGVFINLDPVIGALIAVIFLGEHLHVWQIAGAALTPLAYGCICSETGNIGKACSNE